MKILAVTLEYPWPTDDGGKLRIYNLIRNLGEESQLDLLCLGDENALPGGEARRARLGPSCHRVDIVPASTLQPTPKRSWISRAINLLSPQEASMGKPIFSEELARQIRQRLSREAYDVVLLWGLASAPYLDRATTTVPYVVDVVDSPSRLMWSYFRSEPSLLQKGRKFLHFLWARNYERKYVSWMPNLILISEADALFTRQTCRESRIWVVSNGVDTEYFRPRPNASPRRADILFTGVMDYWPNEEAMIYFMRSILPRIRKEMPDAKLIVAGRNPSAALRDLAHSIGGVVLTGFLEDLRPSFEQAAAYVAPIRSGAGMKNKILEAWAMGTPVVATTEACRGIEVEDGGNILIADHPDDFAAKTLRLLREAELGERLRGAARAWVEERYSWRGCGQGLEQICREIVASRTLR